MGEVMRFQLVDEDGNEYNATCVFSEKSFRFTDGKRGAIDSLPDCRLEDGRSIVPHEEGVFRVVDGGQLLTPKPKDD